VSGRFHFGTSSWNYKDWIGPFYPSGTKAADMLAFYSRVFPSVEVDSSYYGIPRATTVEGWRQHSRERFTFSFKTPSAVTHERRFVNADTYFAAFLNRVRSMGDKTGAILIQCPPNFAPTRDAREALFAFLETELPPDLPVAVELRDPRWFDDALFEFSRAARFTLALTEGVHATTELATRIVEELVRKPPVAYAYIRWLGEASFPHYNCVQSDRSGSLDVWERLIRSLQTVCTDIYAYASNDYQGYAPATVRNMLQRLGVEAAPDPGQERLL
jgi:uncharacterized protein YecE (DUF72 family)